MRWALFHPPLWLLRLGLVTVLVWGWITAVSPSAGGGDWFPHSDKFKHALAFAAFSVWIWAVRLQPRWLWATLLLAYGIGIEWAQSQVPSRQASLADVLADAAGIALGFAACWLIERRLRSPVAAP